MISKARPFSHEARLDIGSQWIPYHHRSGWAYAMSGLHRLHRQGGVLFDGFIEKRFAWGRDAGDRHNGWEAYRRPWIGVVHNPPDIPSWFNINQQSPVDILRSDIWLESQRYCLGLFTLSRYLAEWLTPRVQVPVCSLVHPTARPPRCFTFERYRDNTSRKLVQVGWWLRRYHTLFNLQLRCTGKVLLNIGDPWINQVLAYELEHFVHPERRASVSRVSYVNQQTYDQILSENIVLLHLYDSSANNALIECIVRSTPVLINRLDATIEYLGNDYPLYFESIDEAAVKAEDPSAIRMAHEYLRALPKEHLSSDYFLASLARSAIYKALA